MNQSRVFHRKAMSLSEPHFIAGVLGEGSEPQEFNQDSHRALIYEILSLFIAMQNDSTAQPTRSVLSSSAAWLAIDAKMLDVAKWLCEFGLTGNTPGKIKEEIEQVLAVIVQKEAL